MSKFSKPTLGIAIILNPIKQCAPFTLTGALHLALIFFIGVSQSAQAQDNRLSQNQLDKILVDVHQLDLSLGNKTINENMIFELAKNMHGVIQHLQPLMQEDQSKTTKDKEYQLSASMASFLYFTAMATEAALSHDIRKVDIIELNEMLALMKKHQLIIDHPLSTQILSTIKYVEVSQTENSTKIIMHTNSGKREKVPFKEAVYAPRFVIKGISIENLASFTFSKLLASENEKALNKFKKNTQKTPFKLVLMDQHKKNISEYFTSYDKKNTVQPLLVKSRGLSGKGELKGIRLPSPEVKMETIFLLPGREGSPAIIRSRTGPLKPLIAL